MDVEPGLAPVESMEDAGDEDAPVQTQDIELAPADADEDVELIEYDEDVSTVGAPQGAEPADEEIQEAPAEEFAEAPESPTAREPAITVDDDENEAQQISSGGSERDLKGGSGDQGPVNLSSDVEGLEDYEEEEEEEYDRRPRSSRKTATNDEYEEVYDEDSDGEDPLITAKVSQQKARPRQAPPREEVFEAPPCMILSYKDELFTLFAKPSEDHPIFAQFGDIDPLFEGRGDLVGGLISSFIFALKEEMEIKNVDVTLEFPSLGLSFGQDSKYVTQARLSHLQIFHISSSLSKGTSAPKLYPLKMVLLEHRNSFEKQWQKLLQLSKIGNSSDNPIVLDSDEEEEDNEPKGGKSAKPDEPEEAEEGLFARPQSAAGSERKGLSHVEETVLSDDEKPNLVEEERYEFAAVPEEPATQDDQDAAELAQTAPLGTSFSVAAEDPEQGVEGGAELEEFLDIEKGAADLGATADEGSAGGIKRKAEDDSAEADEADPAAKKIRADPAAEE